MSDNVRVHPGGRPADEFWGEIAPGQHLLLLYTDDDELLERLTAYVADGLALGQAVVVIATEEHREMLAARLRERGVALDAAAADDRYVVADAETTLSRFVRNGWPHEELFEVVLSDLIARAGRDGRRVRGFGEMVALLWRDGHRAATARLERLWDRFCRAKGLALICAYPNASFRPDGTASMREICEAHAQIVEPA